MAASDFKLGAMYTTRAITRIPYDIQLLLFQNGIAYFFLFSGDTKMGDYKLSGDKFTQMFTLNNQMSSRPVPFGITPDKFVDLRENLS